MNPRTNRLPLGNRSGVALVTVMCFTFIVSALAALLLRASVVHLRLARDQVSLEQASYAAESGLQLAAYRLSHGASAPIAFDGRAGEAVYCVVIINGATPAVGCQSIGGEIDINPNNSHEYEFDLTLPNGTHITRDDLTQDFPGYTGGATNIHIRPKGSSSQAGLLVDGLSYSLNNGKTYNLASSSMSVHLYNDQRNAQGKAIGKWRIALASTAATVDCY